MTMTNPAQTSTRPSLRRRLLLGLLGYVLLLSTAVTLHGLLVNEHAEQLVWQTLLTAELDHLEERQATDANYRWRDTRDMALYDSRQPSDIPTPLSSLAPGVHDGIRVDGQERVALVRDSAGSRKILTLDISALEERERDMTLTVVGSALTLLLVLGTFVAWGAARLVKPLTLIANQITDLQPEQHGQQIHIPADATSEIEIIGHALNDYLTRNNRFVERERLFIDMASHELRTPIAAISGAAELALKSDNTSSAAPFIKRIRNSTKDVQELIDLLLVLAKDPARLQGMQERTSLEALLQAVIQDHAHLTAHKDLSFQVDNFPATDILGPPAIVQAAIGNLLRNAIENSDRGTIRIQVEAPATVIITDPGHGMSEKEISEAYARIARGGGDRGGSGIGLDLIARLCEHLGWTLQLTTTGHGTTATLALKT